MSMWKKEVYYKEYKATQRVDKNMQPTRALANYRIVGHPSLGHITHFPGAAKVHAGWSVGRKSGRTVRVVGRSKARADSSKGGYPEGRAARPNEQSDRSPPPIR